MLFRLKKHRCETIFGQENEEATVPYWKLYRYATFRDWVCISIAMTSIVIAGSCHPYFCIIFGQMSEDFIQFIVNSKVENITSKETHKLADILYTQMSGYSITCAILGLTVLVNHYISGVLLSYCSLRQIFRMKEKFLEKALHQDISWYDKSKTGDFASTISESFGKIEDGIGEKFGSFLHFQSIFLTSICWSLFTGWKLALVSFASFPLLVISIVSILWLSTHFSKKEVTFCSEAGSVAEEAFSAIRTVVAFEGQTKEAEDYRKHLVKVKNNNISRDLFNGVSIGSQWLSAYACTSFAIWYGIKLLIAEEDMLPEERTYTPAIVVALILNTMLASWNFSVSSIFLEQFGAACGAAGPIFKMIESESSINAHLDRGIQLTCIKGEIVFDKVHFHYPSRPENKVLNNFSMRIEAGTITALVGNSGSGKSTCIQLIQRFYDLNSGMITIDGTDLKSLNLGWLRSNFGVVSQEPTLFATTVSENIRYGNLSATQEDIERVAKKVKIHNFIKSLPDGYQSIIGERGAHFSGGQKQRIAIARALIREPSILLLDEATSALDATSEADIQKVFNSITWQCTIIIAAHRLSTIRNADKIIVLNKGEVVEEGIYEELMDKNGEFYNLVKSQEMVHKDNLSDEAESVRSSAEMKQIQVKDPCNEYLWTPTKYINEDVYSRGNVLKLLRKVQFKWAWFFLGCIASIIIGIMTPLFTVLFGDSIGSFTIEDPQHLLDSLYFTTSVYLVLGIITGVSYAIQMVAYGIAGENLTLQLKTQMFTRMLAQEIGWFDHEENKIGNLCSRLSNDVSIFQAASGMSLGMILLSMSTFILSVLLALYLEWRLALVFFVLFPVVIFVAIFERKITLGMSSLRSEKLEISAGIAVEAVNSIRTITSQGCQDLFLERYLKELNSFMEISQKKSHSNAIILGLAKSILYFSYAVGLNYATKIVVEEYTDYATICNVSELAIVGFWSLGNIFAFTPNIQAGSEASRRIISILERKPRVKNIANASTRPWTVGDIQYTDAHFSYPTRPSLPILKGLNLKMFAGKTLALVGTSGSGKSTIVQLLERFYDLTGGEICVDQVDIEIMNLKHLRSNFGIVSQEPILFSRSINENIAYGINERKIAMNEIIEAAKKANIHEFIMSLRQAYDTSVGAKGVQLSGGQKQRIAIARALLRNPRVLLLDEATSALDNENEKIVQEALDKARKGRTCIMIAHRLTTVQDADVICVLEDGQIVEMDNHENLMEKRGRYYNFYKQSCYIP